MANYNFKELESVMFNWVQNNQQSGFTAQSIEALDPRIAVGEDVRPNSISCNAGGTEMLRVAQDGFYVRGEKVPVDDKEAETVYNAFKQFLVWAELHRS